MTVIPFDKESLIVVCYSHFSGMLHNLVGYIYDTACCKYRLGKYGGQSSPAKQELPRQATPTASTDSAPVPPDASLINDSSTPSSYITSAETIPGISLVPQTESNSLLQDTSNLLENSNSVSQ